MIGELKPEESHYLNHFTTRLAERYGIQISSDEYFELCKKPIDLIFQISPNKRFGTIEIKGCEVFVVRCNAAGLLNTCLPADGSFPLPLRYKKQGKTAEEFSTDILDAGHKINILVQWLERHKDSMDYKKKFFVSRPNRFPEWMYGVAYSEHNNFTHHRMHRIVKNLCYPKQDKRHRKMSPNEQEDNRSVARNDATLTDDDKQK